MNLVMKIAGAGALLTCIAVSRAEAATAQDTLTAKRTKLLTDRTWEYYEYYKDFNNNKSTLLWKADHAQNILDMSTATMEFAPNNTYWEVNEDLDTIKGNWKFVENGTKLELASPGKTALFDVERLDAHVFNWYDEKKGCFGAMRLQAPVSDKEESYTNLLTSGLWMYETFFHDFKNREPKLVWHVHKHHSEVNMSRIQLQFLSNGRYNQTTQEGELTGGKWRLLNNDTQLELTTDGATVIQTTIVVLNKRRLEFSMPDKNHEDYCELIHVEQ